MSDTFRDRDPDRDREREAVASGRSGPSPLLIAFVVIGILALVFVLQNREDAPIDFLFVEVTSPLWAVIAIAIAIGVLLDRLLTAWWRRNR